MLEQFCSLCTHFSIYIDKCICVCSKRCMHPGPVLNLDHWGKSFSEVPCKTSQAHESMQREPASVAWG